MLVSILLITAQLANGPDTLVVRLTVPPSERLEVTLHEELRLGTIDGPAEQSFGSITGVVVDGSGAMFVADSRPSELRRFDRNGRFLGSVGREGDGPGEFRQIHGVTLLTGGELALWDHQRISLFTGEGEFLRSFPVALQAILPGGDSFLSDTAGRLLLRTVAEPPPVSGGASELVFAWLRYAASGELVDSVIPPRREIGGSPGALRIETATVPSPLGYFVTGRNSEYALHRPLPDGRVVRIERPFEPVRLDPEERRQLADYVEEWDRRMGYTSEEVPRIKPPWRSLSVDVDGRIWVSRHAQAVKHAGHRSAASRLGGWPNVDWLEPVVYDIIDPRGSLLGSVRLPTGSRVVFSRGEHVWVVERGEFDEEYVVRYRMDRG